MDSIELGVLEACQEVVLRQSELVPLLGTALGVRAREVFYVWGARRCRQSGRIEDTDWAYNFHGLECDLRNEVDGRFLRLDFGPRGRFDTFTAWGVLQFIMTSRGPWREFPQLQTLFAEKPPPYDRYSGSLQKLGPVWDRLEAEGAFTPADPNLVAFHSQHTSQRPDGLRYVQLPPGTSEEVHLDCMVAHRQLLSARARQILDRQLLRNGNQPMNVAY